MKRLRRHRQPWYQPPPPSPVAVFRCKKCLVALTPALHRLTDAAGLKQQVGQSLLPAGHYWVVAEGEDFAGQFAVALAELIGVGYHAERRRLIGCCGPSGTFGPNRVCACGREIGTERSDCIWPDAVYLDPARVLGTPPDAESGESVNLQ